MNKPTHIIKTIQNCDDDEVVDIMRIDAALREFEHQYNKPLTTRQLIEFFPDECKTIVPREIKRLKKIKRQLDEKIRFIELRHLERFDEFFEIEHLKYQSRFYKTVLDPITPFVVLKQLEDIAAQLLNPPADSPKDRVTPEDIERAKQRPIIELYSFEKVKRTGGRITALCPFHTEKSGSFVIYANNSAHCFGCQLSFQDPIAFVMHPQIQGLSFPQAVRYLAGV